MKLIGNKRNEKFYVNQIEGTIFEEVGGSSTFKLIK